jgi:hypothetical protein
VKLLLSAATREARKIFKIEVPSVTEECGTSGVSSHRHRCTASLRFSFDDNAS